MTTTSRSEHVVPRLGQTVFYRLTGLDAEAINRRRRDAVARALAGKATGAVHFGNEARKDEVFPMVVTKVWGNTPTPESLVQGQVMLDGNDCLWVTSVRQGDGEREWSATAP